MKFVNIFTLVIVTLSFCISSYNFRKTKSKTKIGLAENLAKIAHDMTYSKTTSEKDFYVNGAVVENQSFKASYGTLETNPKVVVLAFRGTLPTEFKNIKADVKSKLVPITGKKDKACSNCLVHEGFRDAYKTYLRPDLRKKFSDFLIKLITSKDPNTKVDSIYFIGHSLGGALATLAAYDTGLYLISQKITGVKLGIVTFGAPRVGNADFAKFMNEGLGLAVNIRITYKKDPIIEVPWEKEYVHCGTEYHFSSFKLYGNGKKNEDISPRTNGWSVIFTLASNLGDHSGYSSLDDKSVTDIIKIFTNPKRKLK